MQQLATIMLSLDLLHAPSRVRLMRFAPLPDGVLCLLQIASGDEEITAQAAAATGSSPATLREAAGFFIEQTMLHPEADSYRVLGARSDASCGELRRNMALLLRWLHPDHGVRERSVFTHRVTRAWNDLKTDERRVAYERSRRAALSPSKQLRGGPRSRLPKPRRRGLKPAYLSPDRQPIKVQPLPGLLRKMLLLLLGRPVY